MLLTLENHFIWLMIYSFAGWLYETTICSIGQRRFVNRGFLNGPYCPIYGHGAVLVILVLGRLKNPVVLFLAGAVLTCSLEYLTSYLMEKLFSARWWDYSKRKFNINGRVCLLGAVVFGAFSTVLILLIHPAVVRFTDMIPRFAMHIICAVLLVVLISDYVTTIVGLSGFHEKLMELSDFLEQRLEQRAKSVSDRLHEIDMQRKENLADDCYALDTVQSSREIREVIRKRLNLQQRRTVSAFPTLRMKLEQHNEALNKLRDAIKNRDENN